MPEVRRISTVVTALTLVLAAAPPAMIPISPARAEPPKSAACQASSDSGEAELARYPDPPQGTEVIVQMQHLLWKLGYIMDLLDGACRDWGGYETVHQQLQQSYDATMQNCLAMASSSSYCHRQRYGG
jgi:hypothetical protein